MSRLYLILLFSLFFSVQAYGFGEDSTAFTSQFLQHHAVDQLVIDSQDSDLDISIYTLAGERVPNSIWKSRHETWVRYEAGYDLKKGVYLVKIKSENSVSYMKLVRKSM